MESVLLADWEHKTYLCSQIFIYYISMDLSMDSSLLTQNGLVPRRSVKKRLRDLNRCLCLLEVQTNPNKTRCPPGVHPPCLQKSNERRTYIVYWVLESSHEPVWIVYSPGIFLYCLLLLFRLLCRYWVVLLNPGILIQVAFWRYWVVLLNPVILDRGKAI